MTEHDDLVAGERARARELLTLAGIDADWVEEAAVPDAASLGALDAFRWRSRAPDVQLNVYVFADWGGGLVAGAALQDHVDGDQYYCRHVTNGRLLAVAIAASGDEAACRLADDSLSGLAGWE
jgi:hypothetical protein